MEEIEKIALAQEWLRKLANGINPLNGCVIEENDIVNNVHISRCLFYVSDLLGKYPWRRTKSNSSRSMPFMYSSMQIEKYNYVEAIAISAFAKELVKLIPENMQVVSYKSMTKWLVQEGYLQESIPDENGKTYKIATNKGNEIGAYSEERESKGRHYIVTLYNQEAQRFLLEHVEEISRVQ